VEDAVIHVKELLESRQSYGLECLIDNKVVGFILGNLLYAKEDATDEELINACKNANIHEFIANQPDGKALLCDDE
jgi:hypothetical protein